MMRLIPLTPSPTKTYVFYFRTSHPVAHFLFSWQQYAQLFERDNGDSSEVSPTSSPSKAPYSAQSETSKLVFSKASAGRSSEKGFTKDEIVIQSKDSTASASSSNNMTSPSLVLSKLQLNKSTDGSMDASDDDNGSIRRVTRRSKRKVALDEKYRSSTTSTARSKKLAIELPSANKILPEETVSEPRRRYRPTLSIDIPSFSSGSHEKGSHSHSTGTHGTGGACQPIQLTPVALSPLFADFGVLSPKHDLHMGFEVHAERRSGSNH